MSGSQTTYGKAYEYACVISFEDELGKFRRVEVVDNSSLIIAKERWYSLTEEQQHKMLLSAKAGVKTLISMEPKMVEDGSDALQLLIQPDLKGQSGDVRDVLIIRKSIDWEIGVSVKHNHTAVKHSRLSMTIDFGKEWFGIPCSNDYFNDITPIFDKLKIYSASGIVWNKLDNKIDDIYKPLLNAFQKELLRLHYDNEKTVPGKLLEYLLGRKDFYKLISDDLQKITIVQCFNLHGTLNKASAQKKPSLKTHKIKMPNNIYFFDYKQTVDGESDNTLQLVMDEDWAVTFRIHNASSIVEPSLKFDIQVTGVPSGLFAHHSEW